MEPPRISLLAMAAMLVTSSVRAQEYQVRFDQTDRALYVRACFDPGPDVSLGASHASAADYLLFSRHDDGSKLELSNQRMLVPGASRRRCIRYGVDLQKAGEKPSLRTVYPLDDAWLSVSGVWLWRPRGNIDGASIRFSHQQGYAVSAPWPLVSRSATMTEFRFDATPSDWTDLVALGRFEPSVITLPGGSFRLSIMPGEPAADQDALQQWMREVGGAISSIYGHLPLPSPQVLVAPINRGEGPVPWGQVRRGGGASVHLFVNQTLDLDTFIADWTASHEFSHLLHPYLGRDGRWLAEGIASYYQNISRARVGQLEQLTAWQKLHAGFGRGRKESGQQTLREANRRLREQGGYMRVYWTGAAIAMLADVALREQTRNRVSLDSALAMFAACHLPSMKMWRVVDFLNRLDEITESAVFISLYRQHIDSTQFPDLRRAYARLGLSVAANGKLQLNNKAASIALRTAITGPRSKPTPVLSCPSDSSPDG